MSEGDAKPAFDKGDRAAIVSGRKGIGVRGSVFWIGENKYGPGMRFGLRGDDGNTYWVDETEIGREEDAPPAPERPAVAPSTSPTFNKGDSVKIVSGSDGVGQVGDVFWTGDSKYSNEMRYGVRVGEETFWVDGNQVEAAGPAKEAQAPAQTNSPQGPSGGSDAPPNDDAPPGMFEDIPAEAQPPAGELPPEAFDDAEMPPEAFEDDIPF